MNAAANALNKLSKAQVDAIVKVAFGPNFFADFVGPRRRSRRAIRYGVPGHALMIATAGEGETWTDALRAAAKNCGLVRFSEVA